MYNAKPHLEDLFQSLLEQTNHNWQLIVIDDMSTDNSFEHAKELAKKDPRFKVLKNSSKSWSLNNIVKKAREFEECKETVIAVIDADDALCNENAVDILIKAYDKTTDTVWTSHTWDINNINVSSSLPESVNPYQFPWVTSHLKTWRSSLLKGISNDNFKNLDGEWFTRGCDQALYLPLLFKSRKRVFLDEICYLHRINSNSTSLESKKDIVKDQMKTIRLVRARGYVK